MADFIWRPAWHQDAVEIKSNNFEYKGFFQVEKFDLRHLKFSGEWSPWLEREQVKHSDAAAVLLIDPKQQKLVLVEQFRVGLVKRAHTSPWLLEVVAGLIEENESAQETMIREAKEEADCDIKEWIKIAEFYNSPGGFAEKTSLFCAKVDAKNKGGIQGMNDEHEDIRVHVLDIQMVLAGFLKGELITSSSTVVALQWLAKNLNKHPFLTST
ncbi:MAG: NUDIX domain-containing protein [Candidatus Berkiella sp.]